MKNTDDSIRTNLSGVQVSDRAGLAPLEMVLVLPLLMMIMAIIIVFGFASSWKLRTETVARDAIWRNRRPMFSNVFARQQEWPAPATINTAGGNPVSTFGNEDVLVDPMIAGPIPNVAVDSNLLDFTRGVRLGIADIDREPPIFARLSRFNFRVVHSILDNKFQVRQMGVSNTTRRMPLIWEIGLDFVRGSIEMQAAVAAINALLPRLTALDRDQEFIDWYRTAPDFHPRLRSFCSLDRLWIERNRISPLLRSISRVPLRMALATIRLYQAQLDADPPLPLSVQQELQRRIDALRNWISTMN